MPERPANGGVLRIGYRSLGSGFDRRAAEIADNILRAFEKFAF
jgi:hypothetical protein